MLERARATGGGRPDGVSHAGLEIPRDSLGVATPACFARGRRREQDSRCPANAGQWNEVAAPHRHAYDYRRARGGPSLPMFHESIRLGTQNRGWPIRSAGCLERSRRNPAGRACQPSDGPGESGGRAKRAAAEVLTSLRAERYDGRQPAACKPCGRPGPGAERSLTCGA